MTTRNFNITQKQNYFNTNLPSIYTYSSTAMVLDGPTAILLTAMLVVALRKLNARGFAVWLLIFIDVSMIFSFFAYLERLLCVRRFVETPSNDATEL